MRQVFPSTRITTDTRSLPGIAFRMRPAPEKCVLCRQNTVRTERPERRNAKFRIFVPPDPTAPAPETMEKIKNVVFDLGGVLVDLDLNRCIAAFRTLGMDAVAELINPYYPAEMIGRLEHGDITFHEACEEMRRLSGTPDVPDERIAWAYGEFLVTIPVTKLRQIEALRRRGIRTYVLSNNNPASREFVRRMFTADGHDMEYYFDAVYLSYRMHELKPSEAIFRKMIAASGLEPAETLFIDDGSRNVDTAQALGFSIYMPAPQEDFGHLLESVGRS